MNARLLVAAALILGVACSEVTGPDAAIGEYTLVSVDGTAPPALSGNMMIHAGELLLNADGTFIQWLDMSNPNGGQRGISGVNGTWTRTKPDSIRLDAEAPFNSSRFVRIDGDVVTSNLPGVVTYVFER